MEPNNLALTFEWTNDLKSFFKELISTAIFLNRNTIMLLKSSKLHNAFIFNNSYPKILCYFRQKTKKSILAIE